MTPDERSGEVFPSLDSAHPGLVAFVATLIEFVGVPIPSAAALVISGTRSASSPGAVLQVVGAAMAGAALGDLLWWSIGRRGAAGMLRLYCTLTLSSANCSARTGRFFARLGPRALLFAKFVPGLSTFAVPMAAMTGVPWRRAFAFDLAGIALWTGTYVILGAVLGPKAVEPLLRWVAEAQGTLVPLAVVAVAGYVAFKITRRIRFGSLRGFSPQEALGGGTVKEPETDGPRMRHE